MTMKKVSLLITFLLTSAAILLHNSCLKEIAPLQKQPVLPLTFCDSLNVKYASDIDPIMQTHCALPSCHATGAPNSDLSSYPGVQAKALSGELYSRAVDPLTANMPSGGPILPDSLRQKLACWIQKGAPNN